MGKMLANIAHLMFLAVVIGTFLGVIVGVARMAAGWMA